MASPVASIGDYRKGLFEVYNNEMAHPLTRIECFLGHKVVSVIAIPLDCIECGIGISGMVGSVCTLGALKVFIFAVTLGNIKCEFSSGFLWFVEKTITCLVDVEHNLFEFYSDGVNGGIYVYNTMLKIAAKLHLSGFVNKIIHQIRLFFDFLNERVQKGFDQALLCERKHGFVLSLETPSFLNWIDKPTSELRIDGSERPLSDIFMHSIASIGNIPLNSIVALVGLVASTILSSAFVGKAFFFAATNVDIPVPTAVCSVLGATGATAINVAKDTSNCVADVAILVYKTAKATGLIHVLATISELLLYIPRACFS